MAGRNARYTWAGIVLLSGMFLLGQETWSPPDPPGYPIKGDGVYTSPNGHGVLTITDGFRLLRVSGTAYEAGYAHGYLLPGEILTLLRDFVFWNVEQSGYDYNALLLAQVENVSWDASRLDELDGMLDGIRDALGADQRQVLPPGGAPREVARGDLQVANTLGDWLGNFGCSSFTVWAAARADGTSLHARNLDYTVDDANAVKNLQAVIAFDIPGGANRFVSVTWPGMIGCATCFNEEGVTLTMHDSGGLGNTSETGLVPRMIAARHVMEDVGSAAAPSQAEAVLELLQATRGNNLHMASPASGKLDDDVAGVVEYDGYEGHPDGGATLRSPSENPGLPMIGGSDHSLGYSYGLIVTNHYAERNTAAGGNTVTRYMSLKSGLDVAMGDGNVDESEARDMLASVGHAGTIHSVIFEPDNMVLRVFISVPGQGAFETEPHVLNFADLF